MKDAQKGNCAEQAKNRLLSTVRSLIRSQPFYATIVMVMPRSEAWAEKTMATDGASLFYNPRFVMDLTVDEVLGVLVHEVLHVANGHHLRRGSRDHELWNKACDYAINPIILDSGFVLPQGALIDVRYKGLSAEEIYEMLAQQDGQGGSDDKRGDKSDDAGSDPGRCGRIMDAKADNGNDLQPAERAEAERELKQRVSEAIRIARAQGKSPGGERIIIKNMLTPKADWRNVLYRWVEQNAKEDFSMLPPNRRFVHEDLYLPSLRSEQVPPIIWAIDTSGSCNGAQEMFAAETNAALTMVDIERLYILYADAEIAGVDEYTQDDLPIVLRPAGGGGTSFIPPFEWVKEQGIQPAGLIYLTDMMGTFPTEEPPYPVLWARVGNYSWSNAPFGEEINVF